MLACRSLFRVKFAAWNGTNNCAGLNPSRYLQCELTMGRKGKKADVDRKRQKDVMQVWRAVSTQATSCCKGDNETVELQGQLGEVNKHNSSNVSTSISESTPPEVLNEPVDPDTCPRTEISYNDTSSDEKAIPSEKHSLSMEIGSSLMRFIKGKGGQTQEEIEQETQAKIIFPSSRKQDSIIVEANSAESVAKASEKIKCIIDKAVNSREFNYSHFVSLPLAIHPGLVDKLVNFQNEILGMEASDKDEKIDRDIDGDTSDGVEGNQQPVKTTKVSTELEVDNATDQVEVNTTNEKHSTETPQVVVELRATDGDTSDGVEGNQQPVKTTKVSTELEADNAAAQVEVNTTNEKRSTETPRVVVELRAEDYDKPVKANITSIPLVSYPPKESEASVSETSFKPKGSGIEKSIFIKPKTFHLTVLMLKLWNKERVKTAVEVLQSVSSNVVDALENRPVSIRLKGLECMRGSLAKAHVIYAPVEEIGGEGRLLRACQVIIDAFVGAGLVMEKDAQETLKLHATIMNARHRKSKERKRKVYSFDARGIFEQYGSEEWGEYAIREAHLSQRFMFDENGYYHCCASIPFPDEMQVD